MRKTALALAAVAAAVAARAQTPAGSPPPAAAAPLPPVPPATAPAAPAATAAPLPAPRREPLPRGAVLEEVAGTVAEIDRAAHRLRVDTAAGPVTLSLDRNTMVYTGAALGTVLDVSPGARIRAGRNADFRAYWVQVQGPDPGKAEPRPRR
jgi:hypothetical protein